MSKLDQLKALGAAKAAYRNPTTKRGRPRIGEVRSKPWLECEPPMSRASWYRRQKEQRK